MKLAGKGRWIGVGIGIGIGALVALLLLLNQREAHSVVLRDGRTLTLKDVTVGDEIFVDTKPILRPFWRFVVPHTNIVSILTSVGIDKPWSFVPEVPQQVGFSSTPLTQLPVTLSTNDLTFWFMVSPRPGGDGGSFFIRENWMMVDSHAYMTFHDSETGKALGNLRPGVVRRNNTSIWKTWWFRPPTESVQIRLHEANNVGDWEDITNWTVKLP